MKVTSVLHIRLSPCHVSQQCTNEVDLGQRNFPVSVVFGPPLWFVRWHLFSRIRYSGQTTTMPPTRRRTQASIIEALVRLQAMARRYVARRLYRSLRFMIRMNEYLGLSGGAVPGRVRVGVDRPYTNPGGFYEVRGRTGRDEYTGDAQLHMIDPTNPETEAWNALNVQGFLAWNPPEGMARNRAYRAGPYPIRRRHARFMGNYWP